MKNYKTIGSVESFTGGAFAETITKIPGSSKYFKGSIISYSTETKQKIGINVSNGVINKNVALEMAQKGRDFLNVDVCVSFTGNAGPETMENKPLGLVYIALNNYVYELNLKGTREEIIKQSISFAKEHLEQEFNIHI